MKLPPWCRGGCCGPTAVSAENLLNKSHVQKPMVTAVVTACPRRSDCWDWGWSGLALGVTQDPRISLHGPRLSLLFRLAVPTNLGSQWLIEKP